MNDPAAIRQVAIHIAERQGLINLSLEALCKRCALKMGSFRHVMGQSFGDFVATLRVEGVGRDAPDVSRVRTHAALRRDQILYVAIELAKTQGYNRLSFKAVAEAANLTRGGVMHHFPTMLQLRRELMARAIDLGVVEIVAQGLALTPSDPQALAAPRELKDRAAFFIAGPK